MRIDVLTLHPDLIRAPLSASMIGRAVAQGLVHLGVHDIRAHGLGARRVVDDAPYGGGPGMVMRVDVVASALDAVTTPSSHVVLTSPAGKVFAQPDAVRLSSHPHLVVVCGHYEGIDARIESVVSEVLSLGDFVMTGGEIAALAMVDATVRLVPGVLGNQASAVEESHSQGLLEYPQYTRPAQFRGAPVPQVLLSGHHGRIAAWRAQQSLARTRIHRPDLYAAWLATQGIDSNPGVE